ncbi:hypothetical protein BV230_13045, partial [Lactiplantibacillus plantarum]
MSSFIKKWLFEVTLNIIL